MKFSYRGFLNTKHSWSLVGTKLMLAIKELGHDIVLQSTNGVDRLDDRIRPYIVNEVDPNDYNITFTIPLNLPRYKARRKIEIYNYETTIMPAGWSDLLNRYTDLILASSTFQKRIFEKNGVDSKKTFVVPYGVETDVYNPQVPPFDLKTNKFKFLSVGIPHARKGFDVLLQAFSEEFASSESVCLVIKTTKKPDPKARHHYEIDIMSEISRVQKNTQTAEIILVPGEYKSLAGLYTACNCYVSPTRSEGFGMTMLEAMACSLPVITTGYGGHMDYVDGNTSYLINYKIVPAIRSTQYWHFDRRATIAQPDKDHLRKLMRHVYKNAEEARQKAAKAQERITSRYTWKRVAEQVVDIVERQKWDPKSFSPAFVENPNLRPIEDKYKFDYSIIIPVYNKSELTIKCVDSILKTTQEKFQIIIVDNGSSATDLKRIADRYEKKAQISCLRNDKNLGFARACNAGLTAALGEYVVLLNNDTEISDPDWLKKMKATLVAGIWATGAAGGVLNEQLDFVKETRTNDDPIDYICGWCLMFRADLVQKVGAMSEEFGLAFFEDCTFSYRIKQLGGTIAITEGINIRHLGHATAQEMNLQETYTKAKEVFKKKWLIKGFDSWLQEENLPLVSILTLTHNGLEFLKKAVESVIENTNYPNWEWLIADNGSTDDTVKYLQSLKEPRIRTIERKTNNGNFASINNELALQAKGKYLVFLNNDIIATENWLSHLIYIIDKDSDVGCVGSRLLYPNYKVQHCGVIFQNNNKYPGHLFIHIPQGQVIEYLEQDREYQSVTAACSVVRADDFRQIKMFDQMFHYVFEDVDMCLKMKHELNKKIIYASKSILYHVESATREKVKKKEEEDQRIRPYLKMLVDRWGSLIQGDASAFYMSRVQNTSYMIYTRNEEITKTEQTIKVWDDIELSFVTCISNKQEYEKNVVNSLNNSIKKNFELIPIYNDNNQYSAAQALNLGIDKAKANLVVTCHQDVLFDPDFTIRIIEKLKERSNFGTMGVAGITFDEKTAGGIRFPTSYKFAIYSEAEVMINDELCLILRKDSGLRFDDQTFTGFHFYGADLCLQALSKGLKNYAVNCGVIHLSVDGAGNIEELKKNYFPALIKLRDKWKAFFRKVKLTSGFYDNERVGTYIKELQSEEIKYK